MNTVVISGNLTRDPEYRAIGDDNSVTKLRVAVEERKKQGEDWITVPHYFDVTIWGKLGENAARKLSQGSLVFVLGRLAYREWEAEDGTKRNAVEVIANAIEGPDLFKPAAENRELVDVGAGVSSAAAETAAQQAESPPDDDIPF